MDTIALDWIQFFFHLAVFQINLKAAPQRFHFLSISPVIQEKFCKKMLMGEGDYDCKTREIFIL